MHPGQAQKHVPATTPIIIYHRAKHVELITVCDASGSTSLFKFTAQVFGENIVYVTECISKTSLLIVGAAAVHIYLSIRT